MYTHFTTTNTPTPTTTPPSPPNTHQTNQPPHPSKSVKCKIVSFCRLLYSVVLGVYDLNNPRSTSARRHFVSTIVRVSMCMCIIMMTSSIGNLFPLTGPLCGEFTGDRWIPFKKASGVELRCFLRSAWINGWVNNRQAGDLRRHRAQYDVIVMISSHTLLQSLQCITWATWLERHIFLSSATWLIV